MDVVLDTIGGDTLERSPHVLAQLGRIVSIVDIPRPQNLIEAWGRNANYHFVFARQNRGKLDELASLAQFASEISRQSGVAVHYADMPQMEYRAALIAVGVQADMSDLVADADSQAVGGALFENGRALSGLIGRPTTPVAETIAVALKRAATDGN